jgi:hypothetical protein
MRRREEEKTMKTEEIKLECARGKFNYGSLPVLHSHNRRVMPLTQF